MKNKLVLALFLLSCVISFTFGKSGISGEITKFRIDQYENGYYGKLYVTIDGKEKIIADTVINAWIVSEGKDILFSKPDGSGGFENEGQSLRVYNVASGKIKLLMSEYYMIDNVKEVKLSENNSVFLVRMSDGGLGAQYVAVVSFNKGEVFIAKGARVMSIKGNSIIMGYFRNNDAWGSSEELPKDIKPYKTKKYDLNVLLKNKTIKNKKSF